MHRYACKLYTPFNKVLLNYTEIGGNVPVVKAVSIFVPQEETSFSVRTACSHPARVWQKQPFASACITAP